MKNVSGFCPYKTRCCNASMYASWFPGCTYAVSKVFYIEMLFTVKNDFLIK